MAPRIEPKRLRRPKERANDERGHMFAGEFARLLRVHRIDYRQLRALLRIVRTSGQPDDAKWGRFTFRDIVAVTAALRLAGDKNNPYGGRRLLLAEVERVCRLLRETYGINEPLTTVRLRWSGNRITAQFDGVHFEPASRQLLLRNEAIDTVVRCLPRSERKACMAAVIRTNTRAARVPRVACGVVDVHGQLPLVRGSKQ